MRLSSAPLLRPSGQPINGNSTTCCPRIWLPTAQALAKKHGGWRLLAQGVHSVIVGLCSCRPVLSASHYQLNGVCRGVPDHRSGQPKGCEHME